MQLDHPVGVILPVRAGYEPGARDYGIGVNPLTYDGQLWYALPDVIAGALLGGKPIPIIRAVRLQAQGQQSGLRPVQLRGSRDVDPRQARNPFVAMIEERHRVKHATDLPRDEQSRLDLFLKITANATAYGSLARFDRREEPGAVAVTVHGPTDNGVPDRTHYPEDPGPYCFPPVAASITAGARLMLALIERTLHDKGGAYAFMDTDSIAIVATPTGVKCPAAPRPATPWPRCPTTTCGSCFVASPPSTPTACKINLRSLRTGRRQRRPDPRAIALEGRTPQPPRPGVVLRHREQALRPLPAKPARSAVGRPHRRSRRDRDGRRVRP